MLLAMRRRFGIAADRFKEVAGSSKTSVVLDYQVDVWGSCINALSQTLLVQGRKPNFIFPDEYSINNYAKVIIPMDCCIDGRLGNVRSFVDGLPEGWNPALSEPFCKRRLSSVSEEEVLTRRFNRHAAPAQR